MNCIETDKFINSRIDKKVPPTTSKLIRIREGDDDDNTSFINDPLLILNSNSSPKEYNNNNHSSFEVPQHSIDISYSNGSSNPVTPEDREPITAVKRSTSFNNLNSFNRRHRNTLHSPLYPSSSSTLFPSNVNTTTTTNTNTNTNNISHLDQSNLPISRYLPQNQAVITTQDNWRISLSNQIAVNILSGSKRMQHQDYFIGKHILDFIDVTHRPLLLAKIVKRRQDHHHSNLNGTVLICGDIIPIVKQDGTKSSASLWLKEKKNDIGTSIFIWIIEEIFQSTIKLVLKQDKKTIQWIEKGVSELFGYSCTELDGASIQTTLLPHFDTHHTFFGARTKLNATFPVMVKHVPEKDLIRITSMPTLAGLVTVTPNGSIQNSNVTFLKYLFGYQHDLTHTNIASLIPQFKSLIHYLDRDQLLQEGYVLNHLVCRDVLYAYTKNSAITALHRDGTAFEIELEIKLLEDNCYALWIAFDRESVFGHYGHTSSITKQQQKLFENEYNGTLPLTTCNIRSKSINIPTIIEQDTVKKKQILPIIKPDKPTVATARITSFSRPSFTSTKSAIETTKQHIINSAAYQPLKHAIEDYEILDELGQGAYGLVKLACLKTDPEKKRVVIKYVIKSRILIDCWIRDRALGLIPAEIHILHTLKKIPHINCSNMLEYFEDEDNYYIVMDLYGEGMDLFDYIELKNGMSQSEIKSIFHQIVSAVGHLHHHRMVHRDIKDENVILDLKGGVRLIDFGSAAYLKEGKKYETFVGTLDYAAPEILKGQSYTGPPQDIWACGTLLYTLIYRENPFYNIDEIMEHELRIPFVLSEESVDLVRKMLERDVEKRLTIDQVLAHPWFQSK
ncbi:kinase-like domain-containing protein [Pilaira anomala]|nr:kinase-like domain-containing protein [Pilaira anomala]